MLLQMGSLGCPKLVHSGVAATFVWGVAVVRQRGSTEYCTHVQQGQGTVYTLHCMCTAGGSTTAHTATLG